MVHTVNGSRKDEDVEDSQCHTPDKRNLDITTEDAQNTDQWKPIISGKRK